MKPEGTLLRASPRGYLLFPAFPPPLSHFTYPCRHRERRAAPRVVRSRRSASAVGLPASIWESAEASVSDRRKCLKRPRRACKAARAAEDKRGFSIPPTPRSFLICVFAASGKYPSNRDGRASVRPAGRASFATGIAVSTIRPSVPGRLSHGGDSDYAKSGTSSSKTSRPTRSVRRARTRS